MAALWAARRSFRDGRAEEAIGAALVSGLAILYATQANGMVGRRLAIASMVGSWGARILVHRLYQRAMSASIVQPNAIALSDSFWAWQLGAATAVFYSLPALAAAVNRAPDFSVLELIGAVTWIVGFAGESTADRQLLRFRSDPANAALPCRLGIWGRLRRPDEAFEIVVWVAFAVFASGSSWGWITFACPAARGVKLGRRGRRTGEVAAHFLLI